MLLAAAAIGIHLASTHLNPELGPTRGYNDINPGIYARFESGAQIGAYYNSHRRPTFYAGHSWTLVKGKTWDVGALAAAATGYPSGAVVPIAAMSVRYRALRLSATPRIGNKASAVVHLSLEINK